VIGAGGLGCPALQYLAGAGIGKIGIVDFDRVEISNLHRQLLFSENDIGSFKAEVAAREIQYISLASKVMFYNAELDNTNALDIIEAYDIILDCTDQIHTRYLINDACGICSKPWIFASVSGFEGQWALFDSAGGSDYRDVFPVPQNPLTAMSCELNGILGMVPGIIGTIQALEESGKLFTMNMKNYENYHFELSANKRNEISREEFLKRNYLDEIIAGKS
jgi:adenylyltransferase/sulfurtransferase